MSISGTGSLKFCYHIKCTRIAQSYNDTYMYVCMQYVISTQQYKVSYKTQPVERYLGYKVRVVQLFFIVETFAGGETLVNQLA